MGPYRVRLDTKMLCNFPNGMIKTFPMVSFGAVLVNFTSMAVQAQLEMKRNKVKTI